MRGVIIRNLLLLLALLGLLNGCLFLQQPAMIFFPISKLSATPADWGMDYQDVYLEAEPAVRLHGWYVPAPRAQKAVLFLHGNAGNISHRGDSIAIFHQLGLSVFIIDYRGYGRSEGRPSEEGLYSDAAAAWRYLTESAGYRARDIVIFGRSLGGAIAAHLAAGTEPGGLILESTFSSAREVARAIYPILSRLVYIRYQFDTVAQLQRVTCPLLVVHSTEDDIIPFRFGAKLYEAGNEPKRLVEIRGDHNSGFLQSQPYYQQALADFVEQLGGARSGGSKDVLER